MRCTKFVGYWLLLLVCVAQVCIGAEAIVLVGPPGSGKGTVAKRYSSEQGIPHVSTGSLIRGFIKSGAKGKKMQEWKQLLKDGGLLPAVAVRDIMIEALAKPEYSGSYILDGYPRNLAQAEELSKVVPADHQIRIVLLDVPDSVLVERLSGRLICSGCDASFHKAFARPKTEGKCDHCSAELVTRVDDTVETVKKRLHVYRSQTQPMLAQLQKTLPSFTVNASQDPDGAYSEFVQALTDPIPAQL